MEKQKKGCNKMKLECINDVEALNFKTFLELSTDLLFPFYFLFFYREVQRGRKVGRKQRDDLQKNK